MGVARLEKWLRDRHAYHAGDLAARAIAAANAQRITVTGQEVAASVVARWRRPFSTSMLSSSTSTR